MARKIIFCSESLRLDKKPSKPTEKFSIDADAILGLFKNSFDSLRTNLVESGTLGFEGKEQFMKELPIAIRNTFADYRHVSGAMELFIVAIRDADTNDQATISNISKSLARRLVRKMQAQIYHPDFARAFAAARYCKPDALQTFQEALRLCQKHCRRKVSAYQKLPTIASNSLFPATAATQHSLRS